MTDRERRIEEIMGQYGVYRDVAEWLLKIEDGEIDGDEVRD